MYKELNNPNGSDARSAYAGTTGQPSAAHPWLSVAPGNNQDPNSPHLQTGDVAVWANRSAIVVVEPSGLHAIINGMAVPLDPHNPPNGGNGDYGEFQGFFHPSGIDLDDSAQQQPAVPTAPGVTAAPTTPTAPPAVPPPTTI